VRCPERTTFARVLAGWTPVAAKRGVVALRAGVGPVQDSLVIIGRKEIRHADVGVGQRGQRSGRWLVPRWCRPHSDEIPRAGAIAHWIWCKIVLADAAHTQVAQAKNRFSRPRR